MENNSPIRIYSEWTPKLVDRGGTLSLELTFDKEELLSFSIEALEGSYFSLFELSSFSTLLEFVKKSSLLAIKDQNFREIENFLRIDNAVAISKNNTEGILLIEELKEFLVMEIMISSLFEKESSPDKIVDMSFIEGVKEVNTFLNEVYNCNFYISLFKQNLKLDSFSGGELTFFIEKMDEKVSLPLVERIFFQKFDIKHIKLVAGHSLTS